MTAVAPAPPPDSRSRDVDVVCLGESMVTFRPSGPGRLADVPSFDRGIGGAESNVACALARAGHRTRWVSRVGADGFGDHLVDAISSYGVDTSAVRRDPDRPTGVYFRTPGERAIDVSPRRGTDGHLAEVLYYRSGSAASAMAPGKAVRAAARSGRILHLTGITAALSAGCLALMRELTTRHPGRPLVSFDVNYRVGLWQGTTNGPDVLAELARGCDLVFVGEDEAAAAWGLRDAAAVRAALPEPEVLVVKRGAAGATVYARREAGDGALETSTPRPADAVVSAPALRVDVVAPVGAGDAFAAGFLSGTLRGLTLHERLRHGHLMAAAALTAPGDLGEPPRRAHADRWAALDADGWERLRLGPGWTGCPAEAEDRSARVEDHTA
ncbi:sugar kinase [Streptomyces netropsis]|uniref:2-dehydro-3-deoxygluconokinase n=1 Tax=Streptomyces netropsis TaxID=55404 RepID=A0A7W7PDZ5_STRNE|nr:sugar kinase [Streptomyces netropsis]MBB4886112.1 2-dehydro-3-deoxygluconokinase [Streptomyces netropsis]GGR16476.1 carbohydrate kinase [Streptomyces netropsis]